MKITLTKIAFLVSAVSFSQVGIGTLNPTASAALDISSTTKGLLLPRMTNDQKTAIISPAIGLVIWCIDCGSYGETQVFNGAAWTNMVGETNSVFQANAFCDGSSPTVVIELTSSTGKVWMDRNLGATRAALSSTDYMAYGCLYQWGRGNDGHASVVWTSATNDAPLNATTTILATTNSPGNGLFILTSSNDWRSDNNNDRWQLGSQINNPCPTGFHVPSNAEFLNEFSAYSINNSNSAYANGPNGGFKYTSVGYRNSFDNLLAEVGAVGYYWTSSTNNSQDSSYEVAIDSNSITSSWQSRALGISVRCIKD